MSIIQGNVLGGVEGAYQISRSLRFNSADSAYLDRTPGTAGNRQTWTLSFWLKRTNLGDGSLTLYPFSVGSDRLQLRFTSADKLSFYEWNGSSMNFEFLSTQVFRDASAWYNIIFAVDTTQATESNRVKVYVNGSQVTAFDSASYPSLNLDTQVNSTATHYLGLGSGGGTNKLDGYMTEIYGIDGSALDPTSFGEFNTDTGVWQPKAYSGSYGAQGWFLNFSDNASTTTLGDDLSGNGNDWTTNNFSVTAGAGNDSLVDTPTPYGTDTGVGGEVRGNYATLNPLNKNSAITLANGNLDFSASNNRFVTSTIAVSSGKWYWEFVPANGSTGSSGIGVIRASDNVFGTDAFASAGSYVGVGYLNNGQKSISGTSTSYGATYTTNDVIGVALDLDSGTQTITFYKNNSSQGSINLPSSGQAWIVATDYSESGTHVTNFGQRPFAYTAPSGFKALCTQNLPEPTIVAGNEYFEASLWTGNNGTQSIVNTAEFAPDLVWLKNRTNAFTHLLYDTLRGAGTLKAMSSSETTAEGGMSDNATFGYLSTLNSNGFTVVSGSTANSYTNSNSNAYVGWQWKANGAGVSNTDGSITSTVSANTDSGFSIVTYTGNLTSGATVGHGLGVAPAMVIQKNRITTDEPWFVYHTSLGATKFLRLNATDAEATNSSIWNNTAPTSTVVTLGNNPGVNGSSQGCLLYCFAAIPGYSAAFSYTGNGSADGVFVYLGFRARYLMLKSSSGTGGWVLLDTARDPYNDVDNYLYANSSAADAGSSNVLDINANGFKIRNSWTDINGSGSTYIGMAFAESPFKYSLAR